MNLPSRFSEKLRKVLELRRALLLVWRGAPLDSLASGVLILLQGTIPLAGLWILKMIVDTTAEASRNPAPVVDFKPILFWIAMAGALGIFSALCRSLASLVNESQGLRVTDYMQKILHQKSIEVDLAYYEDPKYRDSLHRAQQEAPHRPLRIVQSLSQILLSGVSLLALGGLLIVTLPWTFAVILIAAILPGIWLRLRHARRLFVWQREKTATERRVEYYNWMLTGSAYAKEIRLFDLGKLFSERSAELRNILRDQRLQIGVRRAAGEFVTQAAASLAVFGAFGYLAIKALTPQASVSLGDLIMYYQAFQRGLAFLHDLLTGVGNLYENSLFLTNIYEFLGIREKVVEAVNPRRMARAEGARICFEGVSFEYSKNGPKILDDVSFEIERGSLVAFVGENGAGKSTLIKLLCRLYDPTSGRITFNGHDLREFNKTELRRAISVVFQDYAHYHLTAAENIRFGDIHSGDSIQKLEKASRLADAHQMVMTLPDQYQTVLGTLFENGRELSIGQWQKIALARAFFREAPLIILDEPSSALDAIAEHHVFERFKRLVTGRTGILISHRLSTVKMADCIHVLEQGKLVESGCHEDLVDTGGSYSRFFEVQSRSYR
jgi:ATP-binding cassette subfamily B protein